MCLCRLSNDHDEEVWKGRLFKLNKSIFISYILITGSLNFRKDNQNKIVLFIVLNPQSHI